MKNTTKFGLLFVLMLLVSSAFSPPKTFTLTEEQGAKLFNAIEVAKKGLPTSDISAKEASQALMVFAETQQVLSKQYQAQAKADSVSNATKPKK